MAPEGRKIGLQERYCCRCELYQGEILSIRTEWEIGFNEGCLYCVINACHSQAIKRGFQNVVRNGRWGRHTRAELVWIHGHCGWCSSGSRHGSAQWKAAASEKVGTGNPLQNLIPCGIPTHCMSWHREVWLELWELCLCGVRSHPTHVCQECYKNSTLFAQFLLTVLIYVLLSYFVCLHCANLHTPLPFLSYPYDFQNMKTRHSNLFCAKEDL